MTAAICLSVRSKARRLPGKVFLPLGDENVTEFLLRRLQTSKLADAVILTTSSDPRDQELVSLAQREGVRSYCGSPIDKLLRYRDTARCYGCDFVVVVDGDDPFVSVTHIDRLIEYLKMHFEMTDLVSFTNLPLGAAAWAIATPALERICRERGESDTEVWCHLFRNDARFRVVDLLESEATPLWQDCRMTLDYDADYRFFVAVTEALRERDQYPSFEAVMAYLEENPSVLDINKGAQLAYLEHLALSRAS